MIMVLFKEISDKECMIKLNKKFYAFDEITEVLTKFEKEFDNSISMDFSSISDENYIKVFLIKKGNTSFNKIINELIK
jgi:hypothetical protein